VLDSVLIAAPGGAYKAARQFPFLGQGGFAGDQHGRVIVRHARAIERYHREFDTLELCLHAIPSHKDPRQIYLPADQRGESIKADIYKLHQRDVAPIAGHQATHDGRLNRQAVRSIGMPLKVLGTSDPGRGQGRKGGRVMLDDRSNGDYRYPGAPRYGDLFLEAHAELGVAGSHLF